MSMTAMVQRFRAALWKGIFKVYFTAIRTFPPLTEYSFSMLVKVSLTPGSLSLMAISKWMQKYFSGEAKS